MRPAATPAAPGSMLLHPIAIGALALLLVNDHVLKAAAPGWITGKLSDVAGLALTPIVVVVLWRLGTAAVLRRPIRRAPVAVEAAIAASAVAVAFALVKLSLLVNEVYSVVVGPTRVDPGDLMALPAVMLGWWVAAHGGQHSPERRVDGPSPTRRRFWIVGRAGALCLAVFAIAATSSRSRATGLPAVSMRWHRGFRYRSRWFSRPCCSRSEACLHALLGGRSGRVTTLSSWVRRPS